MKTERNLLVARKMQKGLSVAEANRSRMLQAHYDEYKKGSPKDLDGLPGRIASATSVEEALAITITELARSADELLKNELEQKENGDLRGSERSTARRAEVLDRVRKALQDKQTYALQLGFDINSPLMITVWKFVGDKITETFREIKLPETWVNMFFAKFFGETMKNWNFELDRYLADAKKQMEANKGGL